VRPDALVGRPTDEVKCANADANLAPGIVGEIGPRKNRKGIEEEVDERVEPVATRQQFRRHRQVIQLLRFRVGHRAAQAG
jgi:hypothetical protein